MSCGQFFRDINFLNILLVISGIQPVYDQRKNGRKYSKIGVMFVILHIVLCLYSDKKSEEEQEVVRMFLKNIMFVMTYLHRFANLFYPMVCVLGAIVQFNELATFLDLQEKFDIYLEKGSMNVLRVHRNLKKVQLWACVIAIVIAGVSFLSQSEHTLLYTDIGFHTVYTGIFFALNYTLLLFKMSINFYAFYLRMNLFTEHLDGILRRDFQQNPDLQIKRY